MAFSTRNARPHVEESMENSYYLIHCTQTYVRGIYINIVGKIEKNKLKQIDILSLTINWG